MAFVIVKRGLMLSPGRKNLIEAEDRLREYGWPRASWTSEPMGKLEVVTESVVTFVLDGKAGATDASAAYDLSAALANASVYQVLADQLGDAVKQAPADLGTAIGEAAGGAVAGAGEKTGLGVLGVLGTGSVVLLLGLAIVTIAAIFAVKRA